MYNNQIFTTMARTKKNQVENTTAQAAAVENASKAATLRAGLKTLCNSLAELAKQAGRTDFSLNQLLRESYQLGEQELDIFEGWKAKGANVRKGQHAYLFWDAPPKAQNLQSMSKGSASCSFHDQFVHKLTMTA